MWHLFEYDLYLKCPNQTCIIVKAFYNRKHEDEKEQLQRTIGNSNVASSRKEQVINSKLKFQEIFREALGNTTSNSGTKVKVSNIWISFKIQTEFLFRGEKKRIIMEKLTVGATVDFNS